jgi:hypothetical protein
MSNRFGRHAGREPGAGENGRRATHGERPGSERWREAASGLSALLAPARWGDMRREFVRRREQEKRDLDVYTALSEGARSTAEYYVLIILSCLIATMGLIQGSPAVIIGAMIIAPLMTPLLAFSLGVIRGDARLIVTALSSVVKGTACAVAFSALIALAAPFARFSAEIVSRTKPSLFDLIIALGSGALAAFGYANRRVMTPSPEWRSPWRSCRPCARSASR